MKGKQEDSNIRFVDTKKKKFISTKETTKRVLEYIEECGKKGLKKRETRRKDSETT